MARIWRDWKRIWLVSVAGSVGLLLGMGEAAPQDEDDAAWQRARSAGSTQAFQEYLDRFPTGRHSAAAFAGIVVDARGLVLQGGLYGLGPDPGGGVSRSVARQGAPVAGSEDATEGAPSVAAPSAVAPLGAAVPELY